MSSSPRKRNRNKRNRVAGTARLFAKRDQRLKSLGFETYQAYLASDAWRQRRELFYAQNPKRCLVCEDDGVVYLYHCYYRRVGNELDRDLIPLCDSCHKITHSCKETFGRRLVMQMRDSWLRTGDASVALRERNLTIRSTRRAGRKAQVRISYIETKET